MLKETNNSQAINLTVNDTIQPLNTTTKPQFAWQLRGVVQCLYQIAYQLEVRDMYNQVVWDTGRVESRQQHHIDYAGAPLMPARRYQWRVKAWLNDNEPAVWTNFTPFGTGLRDADWSPALWLYRKKDVDEEESEQWSLFRREVTLADKPIYSAISYVSVIHSFVLFLNGQRVDSGSSYAYASETYYQGSDLTEVCRNNTRVTIGVLTHYAGAGQGRAASQPGLLFKFVVNYEDGTTQTVVSDNTWRTLRAPFMKTGLRNGEGDNIEFQNGQIKVALKGWNTPDFDATSWDQARVLGPHPTSPFASLQGLPTRLTQQTITPVTLKKLGNNIYVADFGQIIVGRPEVGFHKGRVGNQITVRTGYRLKDSGRVSTDKLTTQGTNMDYLYKQAEGQQTFIAETHLAFRYLEISGALETFDIQDVCVHAVQRAWVKEKLAKFNSSDVMLTKVWNLMAHSLINGVQETFVDTPTREKGQFLVDAANISYGTMALTGERATTRQAICEFVESQHRYWYKGDDTGRYNAVYPNGDGKRDIPDYTELFPDWVWEYYRQSGDVGLIAEIYPSLRATANYVIRHIAIDGPLKGLVVNLPGGNGGGPYLYGIIDWPKHGRFGYDMDTVARTTINALAVHMLQVVAQVATIIGQPTSESDLLNAHANQLKKMMNIKMRQKKEIGLYVDGLLEDGTQSLHTGAHATVAALAFGIAPQKARHVLAEWLAKQGMKVGPMNAHWLLKALGDNGQNQALLQRLTDSTDFGWSQVIANGGTFTPESWVLSGDANSESHAWGAQAVIDIVHYVLGIRVIDSRDGQFVIDGIDNLIWPDIEASIPTIFGCLKLKRQMNELTITLPVNTTAIFYAENGTSSKNPALRKLNVSSRSAYMLQAGTWIFTRKG